MKRSFNFNNDINTNIPILITLTNLNNTFGNDIVEKIITSKTDTKNKVYNFTNNIYKSKGLYNIKYEDAHIKNIISMLNIKKEDFVSSNQHKYKNIYIIFDEMISDDFKGLAVLLTQSRSIFNVFLITSTNNIINTKNPVCSQILSNVKDVIIKTDNGMKLSDQEYFKNKIIKNIDGACLKEKIEELPIGGVITKGITPNYSRESFLMYEKIKY